MGLLPPSLLGIWAMSNVLTRSGHRPSRSITMINLANWSRSSSDNQANHLGLNESLPIPVDFLNFLAALLRSLPLITGSSAIQGIWIRSVRHGALAVPLNLSQTRLQASLSLSSVACKLKVGPLGPSMSSGAGMHLSSLLVKQ